MRRALFLLCPLTAFAVSSTAAQAADYREIHLSVDQVTRPDVAVSPEGGHVLFTLLGHLHRVPAAGGRTAQLTTGPYFHKEPAVSPDGKTVAFVSDRGIEGDNVFLLDLATGAVTRLTSEVEAGRPAWSPDGTRIAYLAYEEPRLIEPWPVRPPVPAQVRTVEVAGGTTRDVTAEAGTIRDVAYGPDGTLYWVRTVRTERCWGCDRSHIERRDETGATEAVTVVDGLVEQLEIDAESGAFYYQVFRPGSRRATIYRRDAPDGEEGSVFQGDMDQQFFLTPRFGLGPGGMVFTGDWGRLWRAEPERGTRRHLPFLAEATLHVQPSAPPPPWVDGDDDGSFTVRIVGDPVLSPDGSELLFTAGGMLWRRDLDSDADPQLLDPGPAWHPAFAPDGRIAYVRFNRDAFGELVVRGSDGGSPTGVARGRIFNPAWSADGSEIVFAREWQLVAVPAAGGAERVVAPADGAWDRPSLSADGSWVAAYLARPGGGDHMARFPAGRPDKATPLTDMAEQAKAGLVTADGRWLAFRRNGDLWVADLDRALADDSVVTSDEARLFAPGGGLGFSFDPSGNGLVFTRGNRIYRAALPDGVPREIAGPVRVHRAPHPPLVVRNARLLSPDGTEFSSAGDVYIDGGRIMALGEAPSGFDPGGAVVVDAEGRFAIPGLWDSHHHSGWILEMQRALRHGVTSVRDPGSPLMRAVQESDMARAGMADAPRRFSSGEIFEGLHDNYWGRWNRLTTEEEATRHVRLWQALGARFIKVYRSLPWSLQRAVAAEARQQGLPVIGHGIAHEEVVRSVVAGYRSLEHDPFPDVWHEDVYRLLAATGTFWVPQYVAGASIARLFTLRHPAWLDETRADLELTEGQAQWLTNNRSTGAYLASWQLQADRLRRAHDLGVRILIGTDNVLGPGGIHVELEGLQDAGVPPSDILRMATREAAAAEGAEPWVGTLEVGKRADLVLLDANPLEDVRNARRPWRVILDGRVVHKREGS